MIKGTTSSGYEYSVNEEKLGDWRVVKKLAKLKNLDETSDDAALDFILVMSEIEELIFDDKGEGFEKHILKTNNGLIAPVVALKELLEILRSNEHSKN